MLLRCSVVLLLHCGMMELWYGCVSGTLWCADCSPALLVCAGCDASHSATLCIGLFYCLDVPLCSRSFHQLCGLTLVVRTLTAYVSVWCNSCRTLVQFYYALHALAT